MFLDEKSIEVISGKGGGGICSFRREKHVPLGGPDGGDGGKGGSIYLRANEQYTTLLDMGNAYRYAAEAGATGETANRTGRSGKDIYVDVPRGTIVRDSEGRILTDLTDGGCAWLAVQGGAGGLGNSRFSTATNRAPRQRTSGKPGEKRILNLELKLMADVGLVGFPNAGKSSLVRKISSAKPKVADYPFTTTEPVLGIVQNKGRSFVVADIPGLIEGASEGKGLGHRFLKHIERTRALLFVIDGFEENAWETFSLLKKELEAFHPKLLEKKFVLALNKSDLDISKAKEEFAKHNQAFVNTCALNGDGCADLANTLGEIVFVNEKKVWR
ncbi:MAG: GTPase ObgE [Fibromonadaceae bacterium]|jgi:GTP-binding protein|nr:GTPase ObgE [Fibromonadaceae bacterium]